MWAAVHRAAAHIPASAGGAYNKEQRGAEGGKPMQSNRLGWILLSPTLVLLVSFGVFPFIYVVWVSFHQWNPFGADPHMIYNGADNFRRLVFDSEFLHSVGITAAVRGLRGR